MITGYGVPYENIVRYGIPNEDVVRYGIDEAKLGSHRVLKCRVRFILRVKACLASHLIVGERYLRR